MYWKKSLGITTLSCKVGSMRLRPEWPSRARVYKIAPDESVQYWYMFLLPPPIAMVFFHLSPDQRWQTRNVLEDCLWFSRIQLLHHFLDVVFHDEEDELISSTLHNRRLNILLVQHQSKILSQIGIVLVEELADSRLCGFAWAFDRHAKSFASNFNAYSSSWTSGISCSLLFKFITNLFDPWEILTHEWELSLFKDIILISTPYLRCRQ